MSAWQFAKAQHVAERKSGGLVSFQWKIDLTCFIGGRKRNATFL